MKNVYLSILLLLFIQGAFAEEYQGATIEDFDPILKKGYYGLARINPIIEHDFDLDGKSDRIVVELDYQAKKYRVVAYLSTVQDKSPKTLWFREIPEQGYKGIWEAIWLKPVGEKGESEYKYFNAPGKAYPYSSDYTEADESTYKNAIAKYASLATIEASNSSLPPMDMEDAFYCKQSYYYENGEFHKLTKCD